MAWVMPVTTIEMELAGVGGGWTDISADLTNAVIVMSYGIKNHRPEIRVAQIGELRFGLRNDVNSSGGVVGYYSLSHASKRAGFGLGNRVRCKQTYGGSTYYFMARLAQAPALPGIFEEQTVQCVAVDWMDEPAKTDAPTALQVNKRSDEVFSAILANIPTQPGATSIQAGKDTYSFAIPAGGKALSMFADIAKSELGYIYTKRDSTVGQTVVFENRHTRAAINTLLVTLDNTMHGLDLPADRALILNRIRVIAHPRTTSAGIVVAKLDAPFATPLAFDESQTFFLEYTDPVQRDTRISATDQIAPVATTDYTMNAAADGSGSDLTANFSVVATFFASKVMIVVTNNGSTPGFIRTLQVRGTGLFSLNPITAEKKDQASIDAYGENLAEIDMVHQSDPYVAAGAAAYLATIYKDPLANVQQVSFVANQSDALMTAALAGDISSKVALVETVTGLTAAKLYYVNGVELQVDERETVVCTWWLTPADTQQYWLLGIAGASELGLTTRLGYL